MELLLKFDSGSREPLSDFFSGSKERLTEFFFREVGDCFFIWEVGDGIQEARDYFPLLWNRVHTTQKWNIE